MSVIYKMYSPVRINNYKFQKSVHYGNTDVKYVNSENIPIIRVKYYFCFWDIQYLLLCLIVNYH